MFFSDVDISTFLILMIPAIINLWCIYHAFSRVFPSAKERILWLAFCVCIPVFGGVIYFIFGRNRGVKPPETNNNV